MKIILCKCNWLKFSGPRALQSSKGKYGCERLCEGMSPFDVPIPLRKLLRAVLQGVPGTKIYFNCVHKNMGIMISDDDHDIWRKEVVLGNVYLFVLIYKCSLIWILTTQRKKFKVLNWTAETWIWQCTDKRLCHFPLLRNDDCVGGKIIPNWICYQKKIFLKWAFSFGLHNFLRDTSLIFRLSDSKMTSCLFRFNFYC